MAPKSKAKSVPKRRDPSPIGHPATRSRGGSPVPGNRSTGEDLATRLTAVFRSLDTRRTGTIRCEDLKNVLLQLDEKYSKTEVDQIVKAAVKDTASGDIDYKEFINYIVSGESSTQPRTNESETATGHVVNVFDTVPRIARREKLDIHQAADVEQITADELLELQKLHRPPATVCRILECACLIVESRNSPKPCPPPSWNRVRQFTGDDSFIPLILEFDVRHLARAPALTRFLSERFFGADPLTYERVRYANVAAAALFKWCAGIVLKAKEIAEQPIEPEPEVKAPTPPPTPPRIPTPPPTPPRIPTPPNPEPVVEELPPEPVVEEPPPEPEPVVEVPRIPTPEPEPVKEEEPPLPLTEVELSHLSFRRDAGICPDGWPKDSDCVVCFIWAHLEFRRDAEVCPDGFEQDWQCPTCCMFAGLTTFMFGGEMPLVPGVPVGPRHTEILPG